MVYGFVSQSGGAVRLHSDVGLGTPVKLYLPTTDVQSESRATPTMHTPFGAGERVLVVEDDPAVRLLVREVLQELRYQVIEYADPIAALSFLASGERIDLLISDVGLPGMNGRELAESVRVQRPDLPALFITGYAENAAIRSGFLGTNMSMITKPFSLDQLAVKISETIKPANAKEHQ